jgi:AraC-like DNA-binding protein
LFVERAATVEYADRTEGGPAERREVERLVRRDAFQRAFAELARKLDSSVCGQVGSYGVSLLAPSVGSAGSARRRLGALVEEAHGLARRGFGLSLHAGVSVLPLPLPQQFRAALGAAEAALGKGSRLVEATSDQRRTGGSGALRKELLDLAELLDREPASLPARFERYLEVVAARSAHRVELARAYLEVGGEQLGEAFRASGALDDAHFESTMSQLEASAECAASLPELFAAYRSAISSFANALNDPTRSRRDHGLRRADEYLSSHFQKPISLAKVARTAGFAPSYFSALFRKQHGITFERYLANLRIKRARQLLSGTDLNLQRVAELSGFSTRHYLGRVFKRCTGETPLSYRERVRRERKGPLSEP